MGMEPLNSLVLPQFVNRNVLRSRIVHPFSGERGVRFPETDPTWQYCDFIIQISLCCYLFFFITPYAADVMFKYAYVLCYRYLYLAIMWTRFYTARRRATSYVAMSALHLWSIPMFVLGAVVGEWFAKDFYGLQLPPVGLPNGPVNADLDPHAVRMNMYMRASGGIVAALFYLFFVLPVGRKLGASLVGTAAKEDHTDDMDYETHRAEVPEDYFNSNKALTLMCQSVCRGDPFGFFERLPKCVKKKGLAVYNSFPEGSPESNALAAFAGKKPTPCEDRLVDKNIRQCASKVLHPFLQGKEYQQGERFEKLKDADDGFFFCKSFLLAGASLIGIGFLALQHAP